MPLFRGMFNVPEDPTMRELDPCLARLQQQRRRDDRWNAIWFYGAISFMSLIVIATLPYRPF